MFAGVIAWVSEVAAVACASVAVVSRPGTGGGPQGQVGHVGEIVAVVLLNLNEYRARVCDVLHVHAVYRYAGAAAAALRLPSDPAGAVSGRHVAVGSSGYRSPSGSGSRNCNRARCDERG